MSELARLKGMKIGLFTNAEALEIHQQRVAEETAMSDENTELPPLPQYPGEPECDPNAETKVIPASDLPPAPPSNVVPLRQPPQQVGPVTLGPLTPSEFTKGTEIVIDTVLAAAPSEMGHIILAGLFAMAGKTAGPARNAVLQLTAVISANMKGHGIDFQKYLSGKVQVLERATK